jgi:hypothetical protein
VAYINFVIESCVSVKEAQALARHATPQLTMNVYGRVREERLSEAVEKVAKTILPDEERTIYVYRKALGIYEKAATPADNRELRPIKLSGGGGNRTLHLTSCKTNISETDAAQTRENSEHINALLEAVPLTPQQNSTLLAHQKDTSIHSECATCVQRHRPTLPHDLTEVVDAWGNLPDAVKAGILAMVNATRQK